MPIRALAFQLAGDNGHAKVLAKKHTLLIIQKVLYSTILVSARPAVIMYLAVVNVLMSRLTAFVAVCPLLNP